MLTIFRQFPTIATMLVDFQNHVNMYTLFTHLSFILKTWKNAPRCRTTDTKNEKETEKLKKQYIRITIVICSLILIAVLLGSV